MKSTKSTMKSKTIIYYAVYRKNDNNPIFTLYETFEKAKQIVKSKEKSNLYTITMFPIEYKS